MPDRLSRLVAALAVLFGVGTVVVGATVFYDAWQANQAWAGSGSMQQAHLADEQPIWLDEPVVARDLPAVAPTVGAPDGWSPGSGVRDEPVGRVALPTATAGAAPTPSSVPVAIGQEPPVAVDAVPSAPPRAPASEIEIGEVDFRFLDPPEPGAHARVAVRVANRGDVESGPLSLTLADPWLQNYSVLGAIPDVLLDRHADDGTRRFIFDGVAPGQERTLELHLLATGEDVDAPEVRVLSQDEQEIARARPRTVAPRPRPGPARALSIPKLGVRAPVVAVPWEPPSFVVGQVEGSAAVSLGNTVLIGHLTGPWGDVFARLDRLRPGDEVVAASRGLEYRFVVSEIAVRPFDDLGPAAPTDTPRLSMMTCTGRWNVLRQDYSHRLWVIAEPPELAQKTIQANAERAADAAREAEEASAARATSEAEIGRAAALTEATMSATSPAATAAPPAPGPTTARPPQTVAAPASATRPGATPPPGPTQTGPILDDAPRLPGIVIESPTDGDRVPRRLIVRGRRNAAADASVPLWLLVRADLEGSRWFAIDRPLQIGRDGTWRTEIELGGQAGLRHEIRVGTVSPEDNARLLLHATQRPGQPLDDLPESFQGGARVVVQRQ
jgi:sortase (surface protein transpeptidase)